MILMFSLDEQFIYHHQNRQNKYFSEDHKLKLLGVNKMLFGGDYNPEQWPEEVWNEDMKLFEEAHIDVVTLDVFSWAALQPSDDVYNFEKLDRIMKMVTDHGLKVVMATPTAAEPAWMAKKYSETLKTESNGTRRHFGGRQNMCPNSPILRKFYAAMAGKLAQRYKDYDNLVAWHVSNEYCGYCYCDTCTKKFREWLKVRYKSLDAVNKAWNTSFWGHTYYDWDEIVLPDLLSEEFHFSGEEWQVKSNFQGMSIDYRRFMSESFLECFDIEKAAIKKYMPDTPVTTNFMGGFEQFDYKEWAKHVDFVAWDNYPKFGSPESDTSFWHDLMRGIGGGESFSLIEQTPGVSNWHPYCALKRPGVMRLWSYQAVAHGADTVMFFQMRRSIGACEKSHSALIDHAGTDETRVFREMKELGAELVKLGDATLGAVAKAKAAIVFDFENWWATELSAGPSVDLNYLDEIHTWYKGFSDLHIPVDIIGTADDMSQYKVVLAPMLYMSEEGFASKLEAFVKAGGNFVTSYFSGIADRNDRIYLGGYPAPWRDILGIWVEESDALVPGSSNSFVYEGKRHECSIVCDLMHLEGAKALAVYESDFYKGMPVVTGNKSGDGEAYYVGTRSDRKFYVDFLGENCAKNGITKLADAPDCVEVTERSNEKGSFVFALNNSDEEQKVVLPYAVRDLLSDKTHDSTVEITIGAKDVLIGKKI